MPHLFVRTNKCCKYYTFFSFFTTLHLLLPPPPPPPPCIFNVEQLKHGIEKHRVSLNDFAKETKALRSIMKKLVSIYPTDFGTIL